MGHDHISVLVGQANAPIEERVEKYQQERKFQVMTRSEVSIVAGLSGIKGDVRIILKVPTSHQTGKKAAAISGTQLLVTKYGVED